MTRGVMRVLGALCALAVALIAPAWALGANPSFPGSDPEESVRINTPDDPEFDRCESDNEEEPRECTTYFDEEFRAFGFSPDTANVVPDPTGTLPHAATGTRYADCSQLDAQGRAANLAAEGGNPLAECLQIAGIRADTAWKYSTGDPDVAIAILDTGIRWQERELRSKVRLNRGELPVPSHDRGTPLEGGADCSSFASDHDANSDGAFNVLDYACDPRVGLAGGDEEADGLLDGSDLIAAFSDGSDADGNGYRDDIAGWDFFDDDNDPFDASSCCSANGHGTGRAMEAAAETNNAAGGTGMCPECQIIPLRVWDSFVVPIDSYAMGITYAADNGASVAEGAVGGLGNSRFAREAFRYADRKAVALTMVSSDINSANHNYPTNYNEAVYVAGSFPDTAPNETCSGPGGLPGLGEVLDPPAEFEQGCEEFLGLLGQAEVNPTTQPLTSSFFRNSNLTQYGGKADIVLEATTGSENTGQAAGAAGLLASFGREELSTPLSGNEIRQLLTMTAEDVLPANTGVVGLPDKASPGWDPHFGYGRVNLAAAMRRIQQDRVPPEAQLDAPDWFAPINVDRVPDRGVPIEGRAAAPHGAGVGGWEVESACGQDALDSDFAPIPGASGSGPTDGRLGTLSKSLLEELADGCDGSVRNDAGRPAGTAAQAWPADPYPEPDPERHAFQIRLTVHEAGDPGNIGRYRKTLFAYRDDGNLGGWPRPIGTGSDPRRLITGSGGETSPRLWDIDGDNELDVLLPTTSGEMYALRADGSPVRSFNGGQPVHTDRYELEKHHPVPGALPTPHEPLRTPAIGDIDGDREAEIVATAGEHVYAWELDGSRASGFPVRLDPALSDPCKPGAPHPCFDADDREITGDNHIKRGFVGSPALADLDGDDSLDIVASSLDQHVYAWDGNGDELPGFPVELSSAAAGADGAEIVTSPAIAQLDGSGPPEVIVATNEVIPGSPQFPEPDFGALFEFASFLLESSTGSNPVYAIHADGSPVDGWPATVGVAAGDLLPMVLPGHDAAVVDHDGDGDDEVSISAATSVMPGGARLVDGDASTIVSYTNGPSDSPDPGPVLNLADYSSIGDITGDGTPAVVKGGLTVNGAANLLAVNQNLPFSHVEQAWSLGDSPSGAALPGFPVATDDFQLLSQASIARVAPGPARQALVGTGLYQIHAYGPAGDDATGWPKFTGGWNFSTPSVGDADGDGDLDVTAVTREGWSFLWDTDAPACQGSNDEWWTFHHDERNTANYGTDGRPPGTPRDLSVERRPGGSVSARWTAPGDDWLCGRPDRYRVLASDEPIDEPGDGAAVTPPGDVSADEASGDPVVHGFTAQELAGRRHLAVMYRDEAGNWGHPASAGIAPAGGAGPGGAGPAEPEAGAPAAGGTRCANPIRGTRRRDRLIGTEGGDRIRAGRGRDRVDGRGGEDCLRGGRGRDRIRARDGEADVVRCGKGRDRARADAGDELRGCERVRKR